MHDFVTKSDPEIPENDMTGRDLQGVPGKCNAIARSGLSGHGKIGLRDYQPRLQVYRS